MTAESRSGWDAESLQKIRLIGDRRYRRMLGTFALALLTLLAGVGIWGVDFRERPATFFLVYWAIFFAVFLGVLFFAVVDLWSIRLDYAVKRRDLVHDFVQSSRAATAPRNGDPSKPHPPL